MKREQKTIYNKGKYITHRSVSEGISLNKLVIDEILLKDKEYNEYITEGKPSFAHTYFIFDFYRFCNDVIVKDRLLIENDNRIIRKCWKQIIKYFGNKYNEVIDKETDLHTIQDNLNKNI